MAKEDHWFKFFYKLFLISTQGWKDDQVGAYTKLLINQFDRGGLPDDQAELSKLITSYKKNWPMLSKKFKKCEDGFLRNDFMKAIREERDEKSRKGIEIGKTGGRPKKNQMVNNEKPLGYKKETHIYSSSLSDSSLDDERGPGKEETVEVSKEGFFSDTLEPWILLTEIQIANTIEYIRIKSKKIITIAEVKDQWEAFKIQFFKQHLWYDNIEKILGHFRDSLKLETKNNGTNQPTSGAIKSGKGKGASQLASKLQQNIASYNSARAADNPDEIYQQADRDDE